MKKGISFIIVTLLLVFAVTQVSYGWQGRMAGMGDPYGMVVDGSDIFIHPSKLKHEDKVKFKFHYRFNYTGVSEWNYNYNIIDPGTGTLLSNFSYDTDGDRQTHGGTLGATFPGGGGSMGVFVTYGGQWADYSGNITGPVPATHEFESDLSNPALKLIYSRPVNSVDLGLEAGVAYHSEKNETMRYLSPMVWVNYYDSVIIDWATFHTYMVPYDSEYWTAFLKGSVSGTYNRTDLAFTVGGGGIFSSDNSYLYQATGWSYYEMNGDVEGWETRADFWLRYHQNDRTSFPFMVRVQYQQKQRDGAGPNSLIPGESGEYESEEKNFQAAVGGGFDIELSPTDRWGAGLYYLFLQGESDIWFRVPDVESILFIDHDSFPEAVQHRISAAVSGEKALSGRNVLRGGLVLYYGWLEQDFDVALQDVGFGPIFSDTYSMDGDIWGVGLSGGGTLHFQSFTLEPFITAGYRVLDLDDGGGAFIVYPSGPTMFNISATGEKEEWSVGGGVSIPFN